ncbi:ABC transporter ATP-binding protein, partial [Streptomyces carpinensis]
MRLRNGKGQATDDRPEAEGTPGLAVELRGVRRQYGRGAGAVHALAG